MRKIIMFVCLILSGLMILDSLNVGHALMMFFLAGVIPGTDTAISAQVMVEFFALASGFVFARLTSRILTPLLRRMPARRHA